MMRNRAGARNQTGALGERVVRKQLQNKGFSIIADNYQRPWGEIDIIAKRREVIHFIEVKAVSHDSKSELVVFRAAGGWRPEEQVTANKLAKIKRTIETWLRENRWEGECQFDIAAVRLVPNEKYASVEWLWNVIE